tara:strand:+ start:743 stop:1744 length:1002 start_codon:yes stop_codon:yes gene_type:complete
MNVFFIGMGYMGLERLSILENLKKEYKLNFSGFFDLNKKTLLHKKKKYISETKITKNLFLKKNISLCIISVPHHLVKHYAKICLKTNLPVSLIIEKPFGLNFQEAKEIIKLKKKYQNIFVGLNYRYFSGITKLLSHIKQKKFGKINSIQINFGHGHQPDILKSWKLKKKFAGGGAILDPGIHIINLIQLIDKTVKIEFVKKTQNFWKTDVEQDVALIFKSKNIPIINISISIMKWRSTFEIHGNGTKGYWRISGRGRSYGNQTYTVGERWGWRSGKNQKETEKILSNSNEKNVFQKEMSSIIKKIQGKKTLLDPCTDLEALATMKLLKEIYDF